MATAMAGAVSHQFPPIHLPQVPRVRPPRMLPGQPHPNNTPQPDAPVPEGDVWVQGRWRNQASNAAKQQQHVVSQQVKRALKHEIHGMNIYAYKHIRSSQVVYSLTRIMESSQIMPQLIYHGKKTVPAALRRDVWRPYFSVHFPETSAGARAGLTAYHRLRQFALRRQLDPPEEHLIATEKDYNKALTDGGDPVDVREKRIKQRIKLPMIGQRLPKRMRAKKLMDQKATSVADLAFVLKLARRSMVRLHKESEVPQEVEDEERFKLLGKKGIKRLKAIREEEREEEKEIEQRQSMAETVDTKQGKVPLDKKIAEQLSIEYDGAVAESNRVINMADLEGARGSSRRDLKEIQVLWADMRDGTYAQEWHEGIFHQELEPVVTSKRAEMRIRQHEAIDEEGYMIDQQRGPVSVVSGSSPHIIGREKPSKYKPFQEELKEQDDRRRESRASEAARFEAHLDQENFLRTRAKYLTYADSFDALVSEPTFVALIDKEANGEYLDPDERAQLVEFQARQSQLLNTLRPLRRLESNFPDLATETDLREYWEMCTEPQSGRLKSILRGRARSTIAIREAENASKIEKARNQLEDLLNQKTELHESGSLHKAEIGALEREFEKVAWLLEDRQQSLPDSREQEQGSSETARSDQDVSQLTDQPLQSASEAEAALAKEEVLMREVEDDDLSRSTTEAQSPTFAIEHDQDVPITYSAPVLDIIRDLQSLKASVQNAAQSSDEIDADIFTTEVYAIKPNEAYLQERDSLQKVLDTRQREIDQVKQQMEKQNESSNARDLLPRISSTKTTTTSPSAAGTVADTPSLSTPDSPAIVDTVNLPTQTQLKDKLSTLLAAQSAEQARLEELKDAEVAKFAQSSHHINVADLLPKSYRDPKYWAHEPEDEAMRTAKEEREWKAAREEQERQEAIKREEKKGFLARLGWRGLFKKKTIE